VEASLFAFQSPLQNGVILADEVGLGKTIEAGLVVCQYWSERKRKIIGEGSSYNSVAEENT
jgi:SNF2 family DNA or RNA helicase